jgi:uncharacterized protein (TIGR02996 family)
MSLEKAFLSDIVEHPDDDAPRLVYADWLQDNGDPIRAEFIRVQSRLAAIEADHPEHPDLAEREVELRWALRPSGASPELPPGLHDDSDPWPDSGYDQRGFPAWMSLDWRGFAEREVGRGFEPTAEDVARFCVSLRQAVEHSSARGLALKPLAPDRLATVLAEPAFGKLTGLSLDDHMLGDYSEPQHDEVLRTLANCGRLGNLRSLHLGGLRPGPAGLDCLARCDLPRLEQFQVSLRNAGADAASALSRAAWVRGLRRLYLTGSTAVLQTAEMPELRGLVSTANHNADDGRELVAAANRSPALSALYVRYGFVGPEVVAALGEARPPRLAMLMLHACEVGGALSDLARSGALTGVRSLDLRDNTISDASAKALARSASVAGLRRLRLGKNPLTLEGLLALAESEPLRSLTTLDLEHIDTTLLPQDVTEFLRRLALPGLRHLILDYLRIGDDGAKALAGNPNLASLTRLSLLDCWLGPPGATALCESPHLRGLRVLDLHCNKGRTGVERLADPAVLPDLAYCCLQDNEVPHAVAARLQAARPGVFRGLNDNE